MQLTDLKNIDLCVFEKCCAMIGQNQCFVHNLICVDLRCVNPMVLESSSQYLSVEIGLICFECLEQKLHALLV